DAQWLVLGTMSGPINSVLVNPSFEEGVIGATPPGWSITVLASGGGVPTFTTVSAIEEPIAGFNVADFGTDSIAAGFSEAEVYSTTFPAMEDQKWTGAYYLALASSDEGVGGISGGRFSVLEFYIQFLDSGGGVLADNLISTFGTNANVPARIYNSSWIV